jgi:hypothetical protein
MRTRWKWLFAICLIAAAIQLIRPDTSNPPVNTSQTIQAGLPVDPAVSALFARSCNDCHSNLTAWPWYSKVAPVSWMIVSDVRRGRGDLNFSEWGAYPAEKQQELLKEICQQVSDKEMPGSIYVLMHPASKLSDTDIRSICTWTQSLTKPNDNTRSKE